MKRGSLLQRRDEVAYVRSRARCGDNRRDTRNQKTRGYYHRTVHNATRSFVLVSNHVSRACCVLAIHRSLFNNVVSAIALLRLPMIVLWDFPSEVFFLALFLEARVGGLLSRHREGLKNWYSGKWC